MNNQPTVDRTQKRVLTRNKLIVEDYINLFFNEGKRENVIFEELAERYFIQPDTIRKIVLKHSKN